MNFTKPFLLGFAVSSLTASLVWADCTADLAKTRTIAASLRMTVDAPPRPRVGEPIKIAWNMQGERPPLPAYLVLAAPAEVRFAGTGFMALTAAAKGPHGLAYGGKAARALVSFHRPADTARSGGMSVLPYRRGTQSISWAVVTAGPCGEQVFAQGEKAFEVASGAPEIVVQDRFATSAPLKRIASPAGTHELLVFKDRYEVHEIATGSRIFGRAGTEPNFSPTGRFVAAKRSSIEKVEVADLVSGQVIAESAPGMLGFARGDSYLVYGSSGAGNIFIWNAMAEGKPLVAESLFACMACDTLDSVKMVFDLDRGFVALASDLNVKLIDLVTRAIEPKTDSEYDRLIEQNKYQEAADRQRRIAAFDGSDQGTAVAFIRRAYDPSFKGFPKTWNFGEKLAVTTLPDAAMEAKPFRDSPALSVVRPKTAAAGPVAAAAAKSTELRGRAMGRGFQSADAPAPTPASQGRVIAPATGSASSVVFARLASAGVATNALVALAQMPIDTRQLFKDGGEAVARQIRSIVPAANGFFRKSFQCFFDGAPDNAILADPEYISQVWRWRDGGGERLLLQTICVVGAAGRHQSGDLYVLQPSGLSKVTDLLGELAIDGSNLGDTELQLRMFRIAERSFAIVVGVRSRIVVLDPVAGKKIGVEIPLIDGTLLSELRLTTEGKHLVQFNTDGRFFVHRIADGKRVLVGAHVDDEVIVANDDGLYETTYEGAQAVQVRFPGSSGLFRFNQFETALRRTKLATAVLAGTNVAAPGVIAAPPSAALTLNSAAANGRRSGKVIAISERELAAVRLYVDGRLLTQVAVKGQRAEVPVDLADPGGGRWITAVAVDAQGLISQPSAVQLPGKLQPRGTLRAVVVGVDTYQDAALPKLAFAKADAQRFARALKASEGKAVQSVQATSLLDAQVTPERLLASVREAAQATGPDDMMVIFYAGHGVDGRASGQADAGLVLTTPATRMRDLKSTSVSWSSLAEALADARGTIVVVLDACHAGIAGSDAFATNDDAVSALMTRAGAPMVVLAGSKGRQQSLETAQAGGGVFTAALAAAISDARATHDRNKSGLIDLGELYMAVKGRVFEATKGRQTPWLARNALVGEMALF